MATTGTYDYKVNRDAIIQEALELISVYDPGNTLSSEDISSSARSLRMMIQAFRSEDIGLWANKEVYLFPQHDGYSYNLGLSGDHCSQNGIKTEVATAAVSGATSVVIDATTGMSDNFDRNGICTVSTPAGAGYMTLNGALVTDSVAYMPSQRPILIYGSGDNSGKTFVVVGTDGAGAAVTETVTGPNATTVYSTETFFTVTSVYISAVGAGNIEIGCAGDNIGIELDDGTIQWTYFKAALSTTASFVTALTDAVAVDNHVYVYNKEIPRPDDIIEVRRRRSDGLDVPLSIISRDKYIKMSDKTTVGTINSVYYDPQRNNGILKIWPACDDVQEYLVMTVRYPLEDLTASTDDFDFPPEWIETLAWNLATRVAPKYGKKLSSDFLLRAEAMKEMLKSHDRENNSIFIEISR